MKINKDLNQVAFRYGIIGAIINIAALLMLFYLGKHPLLLSPIFDVRIPVIGVFVFFSLKAFRDQVNLGALSFLEGIKVGMICYLIIAIVVSFFIWIFASIDDNHFLSDYIRIATDQLLQHEDLFIDSIGENAYQQSIAKLPFTTAGNLAIDYLLKSMPIGLFLTIIFAILQRRKTLI